PRWPAGVRHSGPVLRAALDLLLPPACAGCGTAGALLCHRCASPLRGPARQHVPAPRLPGLPPVWAATEYGGAVRAALIAYKDRNQTGLVADLSAALAVAVRAALADGVPRTDGVHLNKAANPRGP